MASRGLAGTRESSTASAVAVEEEPNALMQMQVYGQWLEDEVPGQAAQSDSSESSESVQIIESPREQSIEQEEPRPNEFYMEEDYPVQEENIIEQDDEIERAAEAIFQAPSPLLTPVEEEEEPWVPAVNRSMNQPWPQRGSVYDVGDGSEYVDDEDPEYARSVQLRRRGHNDNSNQRRKTVRFREPIELSPVRLSPEHCFPDNDDSTEYFDRFREMCVENYEVRNNRRRSNSVEILEPPVKRRRGHQGFQAEYEKGSSILRRKCAQVKDKPEIVKNDHGFRQTETVLRNHIRPVIYRKKPKPLVREDKSLLNKRTRVTRRIMLNKIQQFQKELPGDTRLKSVGVLNLAETVKEYLDEVRLFTFESDNIEDGFVTTAVEYDNSVKMFHFGKTMKKHSCKQKRMKFQTSWWEHDRKPFSKSMSGFFPPEASPIFTIEKDANLYGHHGMSPLHTASQLQKIIHKLQPRLNSRRTTDDVIRDSAYFVREFFLLKATITYRVTRCCDIPECFVPPTLECGYFPYSAETMEDKVHYLAHRFQEAQREYLNLNYRSIKPKEGFLSSNITGDELYEFHEMGRHIHGFFLVWEAEDEWYQDHDRTIKKQRYLVDMFNFLMFPLYIPFNRWQNRIKVAFDRTTTYLLHLTEIIRVNRPVFDCIAQNPAFFKPICLREMCELMLSHEISPKYFMNSVGRFEFYDWAQSTSNVEYLSAFMMITGASKVIKNRYDFVIERRRMFYVTNVERPIYVEHAQWPYEVESRKTIRKFFLREGFERNEKIHAAVARPSLQNSSARFLTHLIDDIPKESPTASKKPEKVERRESEEVLSRIELMEVRKKIYNYPPIKRAPIVAETPKQRKKPGRKPIPISEKHQEKHSFVEPLCPSDIESEHDYYVSDEEDMVEFKRPMLKRTASAESFLLENSYLSYPIEQLSLFHKQRIPQQRPRRVEKRTAKMKRILQKHIQRYRCIRAEDQAQFEMNQCYHGKLPRTALEIAHTKHAMRNNNKYRSYNIPRVYEKGEGKIVDDVHECLRLLVTNVVGKETANVRRKNEIGRQLKKVQLARRSGIMKLPKTSAVDLPEPSYLALEMLCLRRMANRKDISCAKKELLENAQAQMYEFNCYPRLEKIECQERTRIRQVLDDIYKYTTFEEKRKRRLDSIAKISELTIVANPQSSENRRKREEQIKKLAIEEAVRIANEEERKRRERRIRKTIEKEIIDKRYQDRRIQKYYEQLAREEKKKKEVEFEYKKRTEAELEKAKQEARERAMKAEREKIEKELKEKMEKLRKERLEKQKEEERRRKENERLEKERLEKEKKERLEKEEKERLEKERLEKEEKERLEKERLEKEEKERLEKERLEKEEKERLEKEEKERLERERLEKERLEKEEKERLEKERLEKEEKERLEKEEKERLERERLEKERLEKEEKDRLEKERLEKEEKERLEKEEKERVEKAERERIEREEKERLEKEEKERAEKEEKERLEKERLEKEEKERLEKEEKERVEKEEKERIEREEKERLEKEEKERLEKERLEKEEKDRLEKERLEKEEKERLEKEEKERLEKERLEKERVEKEEKERAEKKKKERLEKERLEKEKKARIAKAEKERLEKERLEKERLEKERLEKEKRRKKLLSMGLNDKSKKWELKETLPDEEDLPLVKLHLDPSNEIYISASRILAVTNLRSLVLRTHKAWASKFFEGGHIRSDNFFRYVRDLGFQENEREELDIGTKHAVFLIGRCFHYVLVSPGKRKWRFLLNEELLDTTLTEILEAVAEELSIQKLEASKAEQMDPNKTAKDKKKATVEIIPLCLRNRINDSSASEPKIRQKSQSKTDTEESEVENGEDEEDMEENEKYWQPISDGEELDDFWQSISFLACPRNDTADKSVVEVALTSMVGKNCPLPSTEKFAFVNKILSTACGLCTGKMPEKTRQSSCLKNAQLSLDSVKNDVVDFLKSVKEASIYIAVANSSPRNFKSIIQYNAFPRIGYLLHQIVIDLATLSSKPTILNQINAGADIGAFIRELTRELIRFCRTTIFKHHHHLTVDVFDKWEEQQYKFTRRMMDKTDCDVEVDNEEFDIMEIWYTELKARNCTEFSELLEKIHQCIPPNIVEDEESEAEVEVVFENIVPEMERKPDINSIRMPQRTSTPVGNRRAPPLDLALTPFVNQHSSKALFAKADAGFKFKVPAVPTIAAPKTSFAPISERQPKKMETALDKAVVLKLPDYEALVVATVWRIMHETMSDFSEYEKKRIQGYQSREARHRRNLLHRFHALIMVPLDGNGKVMLNMESETSSKRRGFYPMRIEKDDVVISKTENEYLKRFSNTCLSKKEFHQMKWSVINGDKQKHAIEFFTDLQKYKKASLFKRSMDNSKTIPFNFKVYKHFWFMGLTLPKYLNPESHNDAEPNCGGCTNGDVILVHNCICAYAEKADENVIYATSSIHPLYSVSRFIGRFVCRHGPSSVLQLDTYLPSFFKDFPVRPEKFTVFNARLPINKEQTTYEEILRTFCGASETVAKSESSLLEKIKNSDKYDSYFEDSSSNSYNEDDIDDQLNYSTFENHTTKLMFSPFEAVSASFSAIPKKHVVSEKQNKEISMLQERARRIRSKSHDSALDRQLIDINVLKKTPSYMTLNEVETYAEKKMNVVRHELMNDYNYRETETRMQDESLKQDILSSTALFNGLSQFNHTTTKQAYIESMLQSRRTHQQLRFDRGLYKRHEVLQTVLATTSLINYRGIKSDAATLPQVNDTLEITSGSSGSMVMDEYYKFEKYKNAEIEKIRKKMQTLRNRLRQRDTRIIVSAFEALFGYNTCLFEHYLNLIGRHVFNTYAVFHAEETRDLSFIRDQLAMVKTSLREVKAALFNCKPLTRLICELKQLRNSPDVSDDEYKNTHAALARFIFERIRIPQTFTLDISEFLEWLNTSLEFQHTVNIFSFSPEDTITPFLDMSHFKSEAEKQSLNVKNIERLCTTIIHTPLTAFKVLLDGLWKHNKQFYRSIRGHTLDEYRGLDVTMMAFYRHQSFVTFKKLVLDQDTVITPEDIGRGSNATNALLISAIIYHKRAERAVFYNLQKINNLYSELSKHPAVKPLIEPARIGTVFVSLKNAFYISVVHEKEVPCDIRHSFHIDESDYSHYEYERTYETARYTLLYQRPNKETKKGEVSLIFPSQSGLKYDSFLLGTIHKNLFEPKMDWTFLQQLFINPLFNKLQNVLNENKLSRRKVFVTAADRALPIGREVDTSSSMQRRINKAIRKMAFEGNGTRAEIDDVIQACTLMWQKEDDF